jgi:hypothetical protein
VDVACIPSAQTLPWSHFLTPVLLAAQYNDGNRRHSAEILAHTFHYTIIIFILYYLDSRSNEEDPIPSWMILLGIIYDEQGFIIQEYYPTLSCDEKMSNSGHVSCKWTACSHESASFGRTFTYGPPSRSDALAAILRIHSHARYILKKLEAWSGYKHIVQLQ